MAKKVINWNTDEPVINDADVSAKKETAADIVNKDNTAASPTTVAAPQANTTDTQNTDENNVTEQEQTQQQPQQSAPQAMTAPKIGGITQPGSAINPFMRAAAASHQTLMSKGTAMQQLNRGITPTIQPSKANETDEDEYPENDSTTQPQTQTLQQPQTQTLQQPQTQNQQPDTNADKNPTPNDNANNDGDADPNVQKQYQQAKEANDKDGSTDNGGVTVDKDGNPTLTAKDVAAKKQTETDIVNNSKTEAAKGDAASQANADKKVETTTEGKDPNSVVADNVVATKTPTGYKYRYIDPKTGEATTFDSKVDYMARVSQKPTSDEEKKKEEKRNRRRAIISAIGDGLSSLANLYFTGKGALSADFKPGMTEAAIARAEAMRAQWQKEKDKYDAIMLKANEDDQNAYYKDLAEARAKAKADREAADYEADKPVKDAEREDKLHKFEQKKANRPKQDELDNLTLDNDLADQMNRKETGVDRATQFTQNAQTERTKYRTDHSKKSGGSGDNGSSSKKNMIKTPNGKIYPDDASVRQAYSRLAGIGLVSGKADSISGMLAAIQDFYDGGGRNYTETDGFFGKKRKNVDHGYGGDSNVDADIDRLLGVGKKK